MLTLPDLAEQRERTIEHHIAALSIVDPLILAAIRAVPREQFVEASAYGEGPMVIRVKRRDDGSFGQESLGAVRLVPLLPSSITVQSEERRPGSLVLN